MGKKSIKFDVNLLKLSQNYMNQKLEKKSE
jgi:hypothetical protein